MSLAITSNFFDVKSLENENKNVFSSLSSLGEKLYPCFIMADHVGKLCSDLELILGP